MSIRLGDTNYAECVWNVDNKKVKQKITACKDFLGMKILDISCIGINYFSYWKIIDSFIWKKIQKLYAHNVNVKIFFVLDGYINKKKVGKALDDTTTNGSLKNNGGSKHQHSSNQDNHRSAHSVPNSRNNSGGNNIKCDKKELLDMEHSSVSTDSSTHSSNSTASKLSKVTWLEL